MWKRMIYQGVDYGDYYLISDRGDIKGVKSGRIRKQQISPKGYCHCVISAGGRSKKKCIRVHKAVAETFIDNPHNKPEVNHKDGNKTNNDVKNLEWATTKENMEHSVKYGLFKPTYGSKHGSTKLNRDVVEWIRGVYKSGDKEFGLRALSRKIGVDHSTLHSIIHHEIWC